MKITIPTGLVGKPDIEVFEGFSRGVSITLPPLPEWSGDKDSRVVWCLLPEAAEAMADAIRKVLGK